MIQQYDHPPSCTISLDKKGSANVVFENSSAEDRRVLCRIMFDAIRDCAALDAIESSSEVEDLYV